MLNEKEYEILPEDYPTHDLSFKLIVIGDAGVGKSCLTMKATKNIFENYYSPTIGFEFYTFNVRIKNKNIRLQIWDTCGQEVYRSLINGFYRNSSLAILVYSIDSMKSFRNLEIWINEIKLNSNPNVKVFLIGNKKDLENKREVPISKAKQFYKDHNLNMFFEASAKSGFNSQKIFVEAANILFTESMKVSNEINKSKLDDLKSPYLNLGQDGNINFDDDDKTKKRCCK